MKKTIQHLKPSWTRTDWGSALVSGVLLAMVFPPVEWHYLVWFALAPALSRIQAKRCRENFWLGFLCGLVYYLASLHWLTLVTTPGMLALCVYLALLFSIPFVVMGFFSRAYWQIPAFALAMVLVEYLRSLGVMSFSWGYLGHSFYAVDSIRPAVAWVGVPGLSMPIALVNAAIAVLLPVLAIRWREGALAVQRDRVVPPALIFIALSIGFIGSIALYEIRASVNRSQQASSRPSDQFRVALIQGGIPQDRKEGGAIESMLDQHFELSRQSLDHDPDLIIWPESAIPLALNYWEEGIRRIREFSDTHNVEMLIGSVHGEYLGENRWDYYNRAWFISPRSEADDFPTLQDASFYDKMHLVPYGEWIPLGQYWPFSLIETLIEEAGAGIFRRGENLTLFETRDGHRFTVMICFESTLSWHVRKAKRLGADFVVTITNDAWFGRSAGLRQHFIQSQFRAAEAGLPVLRAANTGITGAIDLTGRIIKTIPDNESGFCIVNLSM